MYSTAPADWANRIKRKRNYSNCNRPFPYFIVPPLFSPPKLLEICVKKCKDTCQYLCKYTYICTREQSYTRKHTNIQLCTNLDTHTYKSPPHFSNKKLSILIGLFFFGGGGELSLCVTNTDSMKPRVTDCHVIYQKQVIGYDTISNCYCSVETGSPSFHNKPPFSLALTFPSQ